MVFSQKAQLHKAENGLFGLKKSGKIITEPSYSYIFPFSMGFAVMIEGEKYGYLNSNGKVQLSPRFDGAWEFRKGIAKVCNKCQFSIGEGGFVGGKWGFVNQSGDEIVPVIYNYIGDFSKEDLAVVKGEKGFGFVDRVGKVVVFPTYEKARSFTEGFASVRKEGKWSFIDSDGSPILPFEYENAGVFSEGLAGVKQNGKWGFVNSFGKTVLQPSFEEVGDFKNGKAVVKLNEKFGLVDKDGKMIAQPKFDEIGEFEKGLAKVRTGGADKPKYGYMNEQGEMKIPANFSGLSGFSSGGLARAKVGNGYGFLKSSGGWLGGKMPNYENATLFIDGFAQFKKKGKWGVIDENGVIQTNPAYDEVLEYENLQLKIVEDGDTSWVDMKGNKVDFQPKKKLTEEEIWANALPTQQAKHKKRKVGGVIFDTVGEIKKGLRKVSQKEKWGFINTLGEIIVPLKYDGIEDFDKNGLAKACIDCKYGIGEDKYGFVIDKWFGGKWGLVDWQGVEVLPLEYELIEENKNGNVPVFKGENWGIFNSHKKELILPAEYSWIDEVVEGTQALRVQKDSLWAIFTNDYQPVSSYEYQHLDFVDGKYIRAKKDGKWGFITQSNQKTIPFEYEEALFFSQGLFPVKLNGKWGFLNEVGELVIPFSYDEAEAFGGGKSLVRIEEDTFWIDLKGERTE